MQTQTQIVNPTEWIAQRIGSLIPVRPPLIYVAHPVAPQPGEVLATCSECGARNTFLPGDRLDLRLVCDHDAPVRHTSHRAAIVEFNLERALRWWRWLHLGLAEATFIMPWYVGVIASNADAFGDESLRERGIRDCMNTVRRCDALMACGPRISSGMHREGRELHDVGGELFQVEGFLREPPVKHAASAYPWRRWAP